MPNQGERLARVEEKLDNLILEVREMKNGFAAKWVQYVVGGLVTAILLGFIGVVIAFFIPQRNQQAQNPSNPAQAQSNSPRSATNTSTDRSVSSNTSTSETTKTTEQPKDNGNGGVQVTIPKVSQP